MPESKVVELDTWQLFLVALAAVVVGGLLLWGVGMLVKKFKKDEPKTVTTTPTPSVTATSSTTAKTADSNNSTNNPTPAVATV